LDYYIIVQRAYRYALFDLDRIETKFMDYLD